MSLAVHIPVPPSALFQVDLEAAEKGIPLSVLEEFSAASGIVLKDLLDVVIPARTLKHRRARKEAFNLDESDRLARVLRLYEQAVRVFGQPEKARHWLLQPQKRLEERTPLAMMRSEIGGRMVEEWLIQIDEGMFA
ncbi:antitoxin Xre/MbcA/ParS toxin-binding domain-containing protein [Telmatobacter bradus]|uniref:type II RES/Xre toxin-antitoxin system antitoxin n=1 Tax=Telmatobacter bradus TaxID=474953 RepID=UPI003B42B946